MSKFYTTNNSRDFKFTNKSFFEIYYPQLLKTRAMKRENPKAVGFYLTQGHPKPGSLLGSKLLKSHLRKGLSTVNR